MAEVTVKSLFVDDLQRFRIARAGITVQMVREKLIEKHRADLPENFVIKYEWGALHPAEQTWLHGLILRPFLARYQGSTRITRGQAAGGRATKLRKVWQQQSTAALPEWCVCRGCEPKRTTSWRAPADMASVQSLFSHSR